MDRITVRNCSTNAYRINMMLQIEAGQTLRNQPVHIVTFTCKIPLRITRIVNTVISALTKVLDSTPHGGGPDPDRYTLQEIK